MSGRMCSEMTLNDAMKILVSLKNDTSLSQYERDIIKLMSFVNEQNEYKERCEALSKVNDEMREQLAILNEQGRIGWVDDANDLLSQVDALERNIDSKHFSDLYALPIRNVLDDLRGKILYGCMPRVMRKLFDRSIGDYNPFDYYDECDYDDPIVI